MEHVWKYLQHNFVHVIQVCQIRLSIGILIEKVSDSGRSMGCLSD